MALPKYVLKKLVAELENLQMAALALAEKYQNQVKKVDPAYRKSAKNLLHYLALRQHDIREIQQQLAEIGLSSLGRAESHVLASLQAVKQQLDFLLRRTSGKIPAHLSFAESQEQLKANTNALLGPAPTHRNARIMVTLSKEMATDFELVLRLLKAGMNCARINCAYDDEKTWLSMIEHIRKAEAELNLPCKILMDLMGPKLRTGPLMPGPNLISVHPARNEVGQVIAPAVVWLGAVEMAASVNPAAIIPVSAEFIAHLQEGDGLHFLDTRGRKRLLSVVQKCATGVVAHLFKTSFITTGTRIKLKTKGLKRWAEVGQLPSVEIPILLHKDDFLEINSLPLPGEPALFNSQGQLVKPAHISCTLPEIFKNVKPNEPILFDDGKIAGEIIEVRSEALLVKITDAKAAGSKLLANKGINLPDSDLHLIKLTEKDKTDLAFVAKHADIVNLSFVNHPNSVKALQKELKKLKAEHLGIMLKIETKEGFRYLPHLLLTVMQTHPAGIMIARGDLAVECGWERLAEVQEEILWLCEAAHMPVVWATQVLESLAKKGRPSRAEITDAAMAQRADCVMLNKGPHVVQAVNLLHDILKTMERHQHKKMPMLRSLHVSDLDKATENAKN